MVFVQNKEGENLSSSPVTFLEGQVVIKCNQQTNYYRK